MAGHSHWKQIKHKKGSEDKRRSAVFSKLSKAIAIVARRDPNPQFNPQLRAIIEKAKQNNVPQENINRAIARASKEDINLQEITVEAYGPGKSAIIIDGITDNSNRTINEIKQILKKFDMKTADPGSVLWMFSEDKSREIKWIPNFKQKLSNEDSKKMVMVSESLEEFEDIQNIYTNAE